VIPAFHIPLATEVPVRLDDFLGHVRGATLRDVDGRRVSITLEKRRARGPAGDDQDQRIVEPRKDAIMCLRKRRHPRFALSTRAVVGALVFSMTNALCSLSLAQEPAEWGRFAREGASAHDIRALEDAFWWCDYVATMRGVEATPVASCSAVSEAFKNVRFGGDFKQLLEWWRQNKHREHEKLAKAMREPALEQVNTDPRRSERR
jgi:hypothetical protein